MYILTRNLKKIKPYNNTLIEVNEIFTDSEIMVKNNILIEEKYIKHFYTSQQAIKLYPEYFL